MTVSSVAADCRQEAVSRAKGAGKLRLGLHVGLAQELSWRYPDMVNLTNQVSSTSSPLPT